MQVRGVAWGYGEAEAGKRIWGSLALWLLLQVIRKKNSLAVESKGLS